MGSRARSLLERHAGKVPNRELILLGAAMLLSCAIVIAYLLLTRSHPLVGDEPEYHQEGIFFTQGKLWWSTAPFGIPHESMWKAPAYPAWVGLWYAVLGASPLRVELVQALLLAPLTVFLTWLLARRLFGPRAALVAAFGVGVFPLAWEYYALLYPEALAIPLTTLIALMVLGTKPTARLAVIGGLVLGSALLVRPTSFFLLAGVASAWIVAAGARRGLLLTALAGLVAGLVVLPWTVRNYFVTDGAFVPISIQDAAAYGTFNAEAAADPVRPYAWRPEPAEARSVVEEGPVGDAEFREKLQSIANRYIEDHPEAVPKAFFWNGLTRFWDLRRPARSMDEATSENRTRTAKVAGLAMYYAIAPLALVGLWRHRRRREIWIPVVCMAVAASVVFTVIATTRYRAPLEPLMVVLAASVLAPAARGSRRGRRPGAPAQIPEGLADQRAIDQVGRKTDDADEED